jgi:hypothetical protein
LFEEKTANMTIEAFQNEFSEVIVHDGVTIEFQYILTARKFLLWKREKSVCFVTPHLLTGDEKKKAGEIYIFARNKLERLGKQAKVYRVYFLPFNHETKIHVFRVMKLKVMKYELEILIYNNS